MSLAQEKIYTTKDIYALPDGMRAELIDGQIYYMAPPSRSQQKIVGELLTAIHDYISRHNGACEVYPAPFAVFLNEDDRNYVEPDLSVICDPGKLNEKGCSGAPDWIIDPDKSKITVWNFEAGNTAEFTFSDSVAVGIYEDLVIDFSALRL